MTFKKKSETRKVISFRVTDAERAQIETGAKAAGMSPSDYLRRRALSSKLKHPHNGNLIAELAKLSRQQKTLCLMDKANETAYRMILQQISDTIVALPYRNRKQKHGKK